MQQDNYIKERALVFVLQVLGNLVAYHVSNAHFAQGHGSAQSLHSPFGALISPNGGFEHSRLAYLNRKLGLASYQPGGWFVVRRARGAKNGFRGSSGTEVACSRPCFNLYDTSKSRLAGKVQTYTLGKWYALLRSLFGN